MRGYGQEHEALVAAVWGLGVLEREWGTGGCSGLLPRCMGRSEVSPTRRSHWAVWRSKQEHPCSLWTLP